MKNQRKRMTALALCAAALLALCACGPTGEGDATPTPGGDPTPAPVLTAPDRGEPDRSDLSYLSAIEGDRKADWTAQWIWTAGCSDDTYTLFRKTFTLDSAATATACISAADKYVLWVNGELAVLDGALKRGPTPYDSYFDAVELNLKAGENTIAIQVALNGRSGDGSINAVLVDEDGAESSQGGLLFEMAVGGQTIASDSTWKATRHTGYKNRVTAGKDYPAYKQSSMLAERNVYFDARDDMPGWQAPGYDDSAWEAAVPVAKAGDLPFGALYDGGTAPVQFGGIVDFANAADYTGKTLAADTTLVLPFPSNCQFTFYFELEAPAGKRVTVYTDTYAYDDGLQSFKDTYVTKDGAQSYENYPWRSGSRLIIEAEAGITFTRLGYRPSQAAMERTAAFTSADPRLDQLWLESQNTVLVCTRDTFMDCPERERGPYMGDASNEIDAALYGFGQGGLDMTRKAILACLGWTRTDKTIPSRAPSVKPQEIPNQSLAFLTSAYHYWLHSSDSETMTAYYDAMVEYLKLYEMKDGLPIYRPGSWTWDDWGENIDKELLQTGYYYYALNLTDKLGDELGHNPGEDFLTGRMAEMKGAFRDFYYTPEGFKTPGCPYVDERGNALLALSGLAGEEDYDLIGDVIASTYGASPFCEKYVLEAACVMGRTDVAIERMLDRYAPMLTDEYDTLWEKFAPNDGTINHGWTAAPLYILSKYAAGVRPTAPGWAEYEIAPSGDLDDFSCTAWTPRGDVSVTVETTGRGRTITVTAIDGAGTIVIPEVYGSVTAVTGGEYTLEGNTVTLTGAGIYTITAE